MSAQVEWVDAKAAVIRRTAERMPVRRDGKRRVSGVRSDDDRGPGWFVVTERLSPAQSEALGEADLRAVQGGVEVVYDILAVVTELDSIHVYASPEAPGRGLSLHIPATDQRSIWLGLADGLAAVHANPLLGQFANHALTPVQRLPETHTVPGWSDLNSAQKEAVAACCSSGLQLVWGPPGTGKTHVIAAAIAHLLGVGRRVLLVSSTNIAVDSALHGALELVQPEVGVMIRVGATHLPTLAQDGRADLDQLCARRQGDLQIELVRLRAEQEGLCRPGEAQSAAEQRLAGFDPEGYEVALDRVAHRRSLEEVHVELDAAARELDRAQEAVLVAHAAFLRATSREAIADEWFAHECLRHATDIVSGLETLGGRERRPRLRHARRARAGWARVRGEAAARAEESQRKLVEAGIGSDGQVLSRAEAAAMQARTDRREVEARNLHQSLKDVADALGSLKLASPGEEALVATQEELWALHGQLPDLREQAQQAESRRRGVVREIERLQEHLAVEKRRLQKELVAAARVVGTTLTQIALKPWVTEQAFDHVIVDEAAAAHLPHLLHAVGRANRGAVLVGDYMQNGPIVDKNLPVEVRALFERDVFSYFEVTEPKESATKAGCVVLTEQFRFGPVLTDLANRVAYDGVLTTGGDHRADVVVVTVDGLPEQLRMIQRGGRRHAGWWPIGAFLARALAEHHRDGSSASAFGVVVPYTPQRAVTAAALEDAGLGLVAVGTSHAFQGRQFDVVLADLVEDGQGWMAGARRDGDSYQFDGLRLFNVAATRPRRLLYVLLTRAALVKAQGGPLLALQQMTQSGAARLVDAGHLLGLSEAERPDADTPEGQLLAALAPYVRVAALNDEDGAIEEVVARIDEACEELWCWSAWVGKNAADIADALDRAHQRGVEVHVVARPASQVQGSNRKSLERLSQRVPQVVFMRDMHQKLVIADRRWSVVGSMNMLSHGATPSTRLRDFMMTVEGPRFAQQLLDHQHAAELGQHRVCPTCSRHLVECGKAGRPQKLAWLCRQREEDGSRHPPLPFPQDEKAGA